MSVDQERSSPTENPLNPTAPSGERAPQPTSRTERHPSSVAPSARRKMISRGGVKPITRRAAPLAMPLSYHTAAIDARARPCEVGAHERARHHPDGWSRDSADGPGGPLLSRSRDGPSRLHGAERGADRGGPRRG